jgi:hypothetical protein
MADADGAPSVPYSCPGPRGMHGGAVTGRKHGSRSAQRRLPTRSLQAAPWPPRQAKTWDSRGRLTSLRVRVGDHVTAGDVLAKIDTFAARQA